MALRVLTLRLVTPSHHYGKGMSGRIGVGPIGPRTRDRRFGSRQKGFTVNSKLFVRSLPFLRYGKVSFIFRSIFLFIIFSFMELYRQQCIQLLCFCSQRKNMVASFDSTSWRDPTKKEKNVTCHSEDANIRVIPTSTDLWGAHDEPRWDSEDEPDLTVDIVERFMFQVAVGKTDSCGPIRCRRTRTRLDIIE